MAQTKAQKEAAKNQKAADALPEEVKRTKVIEEFLSANAPKQAQAVVPAVSPIIAKLWIVIDMLIPHIVLAYKKLLEVHEKVPKEWFLCAIGFVMCFFGGAFPATIAVVEAWFMFGGKKTTSQIKDMYLAINKKNDGDDSAAKEVEESDDVDVRFFMVKIQSIIKASSPTKMNELLASICTVFVSVVCILRVQFARALALGAVIGETLNSLVSESVEKKFSEIVPEDLRAWVPFVAECVCKGAVMFIAYVLVSIVSAAHGAVRGSIILSRNLVLIPQVKKLVPMEAEKLGWILAAVGFVFQLFTGFSVPFLLNLVLFPAQLVEAYISWMFLA